MLRVVLDTNVLLVSISPNAPNHWIIRHFMDEGFILCVTTDILLEYEEVITRHMGALTATNFMEALDNAPHVELITRYFKWDLIEADPDDNKFVDCAIAGNARFIVTEDKHFRILNQVEYPKVGIIGIAEFKKELEGA
ncbi:MAG: putative toxin-antitoxin system toxin component, PIN family [Saprospirales bacterium]|nr:putative toxin-antitoxin system toxin component, PIN family [Saprospirales bacterium]MBK8920095.1 putative toxin-antitoxin system toxin component, PIN family [Saprospirales bacterium]